MRSGLTPFIDDDASELGLQLQKLKRALIDAHVMQHAPLGSMTEDMYAIMTPGVEGGDSCSITRPDATGEGGGQYRTTSLGFNTGLDQKITEQYVASFDNIRSTIDNIFTPWLSRPNAADIRQLRNLLQMRAGELNTDLTISTKTVGFSAFTGELRNTVAATYLTGGAWEVLRSRFLNNLEPSVSLLRDLGVFLASIVAAEENLWEETSRTLLELATGATSAANEVATGGSGTGVDIALNVAGWVLTGIGLIIPGVGPASTVVKFGSLGIDILRSTSSKTDKLKVGGTSADAIQENLVELLSKLNAQIEEEESKLRRGLSDMRVQLRTDSIQALIDPSPSVIYTVADVSIQVSDFPKARTLARTDLPKVAGELKKVANSIGFHGMSGYISRDPSIGLGRRGPGDEWTELQNTWRDLILNLAWDTETAATNIELALNAIEEGDEEARSRLASYAAKIDGQNPYHPWDAGK